MIHTTTSPEVQMITDREIWNAFLLSQERAHLLQSYEWGELYRYLGVRVYRLGLMEEGQLTAAMMLSVSTVPIPKLNLRWLYCCRGPIIKDTASPALTLLLEKAQEIAREEKAVILRLEPDILEDDRDRENWQNILQGYHFRTNPVAVHGRTSWVLDLRPDLEQIHKSFRKAWRQNIRLAERSGVMVRPATSDADFDAYYDLLTETSKRDRFFIHGRDYHREILRQFSEQGNAMLFIAEHEGEAIAAKMLIRLGERCWDMFASTTSKLPHIPKSHILQYHSIQWAKEQGCIYFDFRTVPDNPQPDEPMWGVYHFKKGFGGFPEQHIQTLDYVYRPFFYYLWRSLVSARRNVARMRHKMTHQSKTQAAGHKTTHTISAPAALQPTTGPITKLRLLLAKVLTALIIACYSFDFVSNSLQILT